MHPLAIFVGSFVEMHLSFWRQVPSCEQNTIELQFGLRSQMSLHSSNDLPLLSPTELPSDNATLSFPRLSQLFSIEKY